MVFRTDISAGGGRSVLRGKMRGFTLVEVLVVLIIVAMVSTLLFQFLGKVYKLQSGLGVEQFNESRQEMSLDWFRQSVHGLQPDFGKGDNKFAGTRTRFSGLSNNPLSEEYGAATKIAWELVFDSETGETRLVYDDGRGKSTIGSWVSGEYKFVYVDESMAQHESWPPELGKWPQLPKLIFLDLPRADPPLVVVAMPMNASIAPPTIQEALGISK